MLVLSAEIKVRSQVSLCGICSQQSGTGIGFSLSILVFPCWYYFINTQGNRRVDKRQVLKIWENYVAELYDRPN